MNLKPQDLVVALKLCAYPGARPAMSVIANELSLSPSEVHGAIGRLRASRLLHGPGLKGRPNISALEEFLIHGLKYAFPAEHGEVTRGIPTSYAAEPLKSEIAASSDLPPVWPWHEGDTRGIGLEPLLGELVFVGGCATALLITDKAAADVRPTFDVDAIAEITSYAGYTEFSDRLRNLGFQEDAREGAPLCRWRQNTTTLDVMPLDAKILGFSNTWYRPAMDHAEERELEKGLKIRLVAPVYFCASKLEAFAGRGKNDFAGSRDLEDLIAVVDGRGELVGEIRAAESNVRSYLAKEIKRLISIPAFNDALPGHVPPDAASQERVGTIILRLTEIASL